MLGATSISYRVPFGRARLCSVDGTRIAFPVDLPMAPGLYRIRPRVSDNMTAYFGEAADLRRRFQRYRTPGSSQLTNLRVQTRILETVVADGGVTVEVATSATANLIATVLLDEMAIRHSVDQQPKRASR